MNYRPTPATVSIRCDNQRIAHESIIWLEGDGNYTRIHRNGQPAKLIARTLKLFEPQLVHFIRVRRDAMINPTYLRAVSRDTDRPERIHLLLSNGETIVVARRRLAEVQARLKLYQQTEIC